MNGFQKNEKWQKSISLLAKINATIEYFDEITSTNDFAMSHDLNHGTIVLTESQTKGRGQRGNRWDSVPGENLTFSLLINPEEFPAEDQFYISKVSAISVSQSLCDMGIDYMIKWPNDIYVKDRKIAGILIENSMMGGYITSSVIGIGINVNQQTFNNDIPNPTSMLLEGSNKQFDRDEVLECFISTFFKLYELIKHLEPEVIDNMYLDKLYKFDTYAKYREPGGEPFMAKIKDVLETGELILEDENGIIHKYAFKEVEFMGKYL